MQGRQQGWFWGDPRQFYAPARRGFCLLLIASGAPIAAAADLQVEIEGIEPVVGLVQIGVSSSAADFSGKPTFGQRVKAEAAKTVVVFRDLPAGRYAVSAYLDENANNKLDRGMFGIPKERYGFSQDARGVGGPPEFRDAVFDLPAAGARVSIRLR